MPNIINKVTKALSRIVFLLVITGGAVFHFSRMQIDFSNVEVWSLAFLVFSYLSFRMNAFNLLDLGALGRRFSNPHFQLRSSFFFLSFVGGLLFIGHCFRHWSLSTHGFDVSYAHQALFFPYDKGVWLKASVSKAGTVLGDHLMFAYIFLSPLTMFLHYDEWIFFLQVVLLCGTLWFFVTRSPLKTDPGILLSVFIIILAHRGLRSGMLFDFREDVLAFVGLLGMIFSLWKKSVACYFLFLIFTLLCKENLFAVTFFFGIPILFSETLRFSKFERQLLFVGTVGLSMIYGYLALKIFIPHYTVLKNGDHPIVGRFSSFGKTVPEIAFHILTTPRYWGEILKTCFGFNKIKYIVFVLGPYAFFYRSKEVLWWAVLAVPGIMMNICHDYTNMIALVFHYELIVLPGLIAALVLGIADMNKTTSSGRPSPLFWGVLIALCFSGKWPGHFITSKIPTASEWHLYRELHHLDKTKKVAVDLRFSSQINYLRDFILFDPGELKLYEQISPTEWMQKVDTWIIDPQSKEEHGWAQYLFAHGFQLSPGISLEDPAWILVRR